MAKFFFSLVLLLSLTSLNCYAKSAETDRYEIKFGIMEVGPDGQYYVVKETTTIPKLAEDTGFKFGYTIKNLANHDFFTSLAIYPPSAVTVAKFTKRAKNAGEVKNGGKIIKIQPLLTKEGMAINSFSFDRADPTGVWKLEIYADNRLLRIINFSVVNAQK